jgi:hypothetical protein
MSLTIDGPADLPALYQSADRESVRAQRSYLTSLRVRLGALLVAAFGGAVTLTTPGNFQIGGGLAFLAFACALGAELFLATTGPLRLATKAGLLQSRPRHSPGGTWCERNRSISTLQRWMRSSSPRRTHWCRTFGRSPWTPASPASIRSAPRCVKCGPSTSLGVGRSIWKTGLPTSNAGTPRRPAGTTGERAWVLVSDLRCSVRRVR